MNIIQAKDYKLRADLENYVRNTFGLTPDKKIDTEIKGTREELALLQLSDKSTFWGIICSITDTPTKKIEVEKPSRGKIFKSKLK